MSRQWFLLYLISVWKAEFTLNNYFLDFYLVTCNMLYVKYVQISVWVNANGDWCLDMYIQVALSVYVFRRHWGEGGEWKWWSAKYALSVELSVCSSYQRRAAHSTATRPSTVRLNTSHQLNPVVILFCRRRRMLRIQATVFSHRIS